MLEYYFTFTSKQVNKSGLNMFGWYVKVIAEDFATARRYFILRFSGENMPSPLDFAMQYTKDEFQPKYYPHGEFACIEQEQD